MRGRDVSKRILMEFTIAFNEIQYIVIRNSKLAGPTNLEKKDLNQYLFINAKGGIHLLLPVPHGGSGMKTGGAHSFFLIWSCQIVYN